MNDECENHRCPKCGEKMTDRACLRCVNSEGKQIKMIYCVFCDGRVEEPWEPDSMSSAIRDFFRKRN